MRNGIAAEWRCPVPWKGQDPHGAAPLDRTNQSLLSRVLETDEVLSLEVEQYRAVLFARLIRVISPIVVIAMGIQVLMMPRLFVTFATTVFALGLFVLAASKLSGPNFRQARAVVLVGIVVVCVFSGIWDQPNHVWWAYMVMPVLLASVFSSLRNAALFALYAFLATAAVLMVRGDGLAVAAAVLRHHAVFSPLVLFAAHQRDTFECHRRAELQSTRARLNRAELLAGVGHWTFDGGVVSLSPAVHAALGNVEPAMSLDDFCGRLVDGRTGFDAFLQARHGSMATVQLKYLRGDEQRWALLTCTDKDRSPIVGTLQDVTEVVAAAREEEQLRHQSHDAHRLESIGLARVLPHEEPQRSTVDRGLLDVVEMEPPRCKEVLEGC